MNVWKIAPGRNASEWDWMQDCGCIAIGWLNDDDLSDVDKDAIKRRLEASDEGSWNSANSIDQFVHEVMMGDVVVANKGLSEVVGIGIVESDYLAPDHSRNPRREDESFRQVYLVDWKISESVHLKAPIFNQPTVQKLTDEQISSIRDAYLRTHPKSRPLLKRLLGAKQLDFADATDAAEDGEGKYSRSAKAQRKLIVRQIKARRGQEKFRNGMRKRYSDTCVVTGCSVLHILEAAHIDSHVDESSNHPGNGLLLRADIHTLFDLDLIGIEPQTLMIEVHPSLRSDATYGKLNGRKLKRPNSKGPADKPLQRRYKRFKKRSQSPL